MAQEQSQTPDGGGQVSGQGGPGYSGFRAGGDPTTEPGQYPPTADHGIFGGPLPSGTGAPGTQGATRGSADPTNEPGQTSDGLTGITDEQIAKTGAPGTSTTPNTSGGSAAITYTRAGSPYSGTYKSETVSDDISGVRDATQANDQGYASGGPQLPGIAGNEPRAGEGRFQPGSGNVLRGGRAVRP
jgi:hypothetical protein